MRPGPPGGHGNVPGFDAPAGAPPAQPAGTNMNEMLYLTVYSLFLNYFRFWVKSLCPRFVTTYPTNPQMQNSECQPDFEVLSSGIDKTLPGFAPGTVPLLTDTRIIEPENQMPRSQQDKDSDEQMQELLLIWNSRHANDFTSAGESRVSSSTSTVIQVEGAIVASFLPAPRRYHPSVWKAWTRHLVKIESSKQK
jgi:hypothetical protein